MIRRIGFALAVVLAVLSFTIGLSAQLTGPVTSGTLFTDGANPSSVRTGLKTLTACVVSSTRITAPGVNASIFTVQFTPNAGILDVYAWKVTSSSDTTLIASTVIGDQIVYICTGSTS